MMVRHTMTTMITTATTTTTTTKVEEKDDFEVGMAVRQGKEVRIRRVK